MFILVKSEDWAIVYDYGGDYDLAIAYDSSCDYYRGDHQSRSHDDSPISIMTYVSSTISIMTHVSAPIFMNHADCPSLIMMHPPVIQRGGASNPRQAAWAFSDPTSRTARTEQLKMLQGLLPKSEGQNLASTVLCVPYSVHSLID